MFFPVMVDLSAMEVLVVGGGRIACRKVKKLLEFGGRVKVIAPEFCKELYSLAQSMDEGKSLTMISRAFEVTDLEGQDLVYLATDDKDLNGRIGDLCRSKKTLVNRLDDHRTSSFINMATTNKEYRDQEVLLAVSCFGENPSLTKDLCKKLDEEFLEDK